MSPFDNKKILLIVTGSIAAYKVADLTSQLRKQGANVRVVLTQSAERFIGRATFEALSGNPVYHSMWTEGASMAHIELARWADLILAAPASAGFISDLAQGSSHTLATAISLAYDFKIPYLLAPAMNPSMLSHPATQKNLKTLAQWGMQVLPSGSGLMACQEVGEGRLPEPSTLLFYIKRAFNTPLKFTPLYFTVTAGGTQSPIDEVRAVTNFSTGSTGIQLTEHLLALGHRVHLIKSARTTAQEPDYFRDLILSQDLKMDSFETADDLESILITSLKAAPCDGLIQAAAISDFDVTPPEGQPTNRGKVSSNKPLTLQLTPRKKTLNKIRSLFPDLSIIGFKLTAGAHESEVTQKISQLFSQSEVDWVVHNDLHAMGSKTHPFNIISKNLSTEYSSDQIENLAKWIHTQYTRSL